MKTLATNNYQVERETIGHVQLLTTKTLSTTEDEYLQGYEAAQMESDESSNPFALNSRAYDNWNDGWWDGFYNEAPRFSLSSENIVPFPLPLQHGKEQAEDSAQTVIMSQTSQTAKRLNRHFKFFKQPRMDIFFEVFATLFFVGLAYELAS